MIPSTGETWHSPLLGYTVRIKDVNLRDGSVLVSDGRRTLRMYLSAFRDPRNQWKRKPPTRTR